MLTLAFTYAGLLGGAGRTLIDFGHGLPGGVALACPEGPLADRARAEGLPVFGLPEHDLDFRAGLARRVRTPLEMAAHARDVRRLAEALRPDLLIAWGMRSVLAAPLVMAGLRPRPVLLVRQIELPPGAAIARLVRASVRGADVVSVNSRAVAREIDPHGSLGERLSVISPGLDPAAHDCAWDVGPEPEVLVLGAVTRVKRPELALEAVALAARELPDLRLTIVGSPMSAEGERLLAQLRRRAERADLAGRVSFLGELPDARDALRRAWCLLHCADREAFGSAVLQALASGRPVVAPAAGGSAELVDASCGRLYPPGDADAAARALIEVLGAEDVARRLGAAGRERARAFDASEARAEFARVASAAVAAKAGGAGRASSGAGMALVTVTHNSSAVVGRLLESAQRQLPGARLIVVDSGSSDDSAQTARRAARAATVVELTENVGFGRGSNEGVALAGEPVCVLVNPDVELVDGSLAALAQELLAPGGERRILAPRVLSPDGTRQDTGQLDPRSPLMLVRALIPPALFPAALRVALDPWRSRRRRRVGWAVGCCLVARTDTFRALGPFDERIFMFGEDLELGLHADAEGVETWLCPDARVLHLDAHSTAPAFGGEPFDLHARQRRAVVGERRGPAAARRDHWIWLLTYADRIALKAITRRPHARERRQLAAQWRARRAPARLGERSAR